MGLVKKIFFVGLIAGMAFFGGRLSHKVDVGKKYVFNYIDSHEEDRKEIFLYGLEHLKRDDPDFLDSFTINSLNGKQKEEIARDYLYEEGKKTLRNLPEKLYEFFFDSE